MNTEDKTTKIVGGNHVQVGRYPYQVALSMTCSGCTQFCGGTLIAKDIVLSAAHCANYGKFALIGRHDLSAEEAGAESIFIRKQIVHPGYRSDTMDNDIMLLKLDRPSQYTPVQLDYGDENITEGTDVITMGWGTTSEGGKSSDILQEVELDIVPNDVCDGQYTNYRITDSMLCAARSGKDSCQGDSGGPLIIAGSNATEDVQIGVVSWGIGCARDSFSGVYARVSQYRDFIDCVLADANNNCGDTTTLEKPPEAPTFPKLKIVINLKKDRRRKRG